jgi:rhodanese-related sulfurtransferase
MPPLAGSEGVPAASFFALDGIGSFLWSSCYVALGYAFSSQLEVAIRWAEHFGKTVGIAIGLPILLYVAWRGMALMQMVLRLRLRRISPPLLARKLKSKSNKVAVLDLSHFEEERDSGTVEAIPGAFMVDPALLRKSPRIVVPDDVKLILYSSNGSATVCARAAIGLKRVGIHNVWVLDGGLHAWREHGFPLSRSPEIPEVVARRLGVTLPAGSEKSSGEQCSRPGDAISDCQ